MLRLIQSTDLLSECQTTGYRSLLPNPLCHSSDSHCLVGTLSVLLTYSLCHQHQHRRHKSTLYTGTRCPQLILARTVTLLPTTLSLRQLTASHLDYRSAPAAQIHLWSNWIDIKRAMPPARLLRPGSWQTEFSVNFIVPPFSSSSL